LVAEYPDLSGCIEATPYAPFDTPPYGGTQGAISLDIDSDSDIDSDTESDSDSDANTDADADTDADSDSDTDTYNVINKNLRKNI
jgi:hypothetical protein